MLVKAPIEQVLLARADLKALGINVSNITLLRWERLHRFPRRLRPGGTTVAWRKDEILRWIEERSLERHSHVYAEY